MEDISCIFHLLPKIFATVCFTKICIYLKESSQYFNFGRNGNDASTSIITLLIFFSLKAKMVMYIFLNVHIFIKTKKFEETKKFTNKSCKQDTSSMIAYIFVKHA